MRVEAMDRSASMRSSKPLVFRGSLVRTFGSLGTFLAVSFLFCGLYLLGDAFAHPLDANPMAIFSAALSIAIASILFYYLFKPRGRQRQRSSHLKRGG